MENSDRNAWAVRVEPRLVVRDVVKEVFSRCCSRIYFNVFKRIQSKYQNVQFYELRNVAPKLLASENL